MNFCQSVGYYECKQKRGNKVRSRVKSKMGNAWENLSCEGVVPNYKHVCTKQSKFLTVVKPSTVGHK